MDNLRELEQKLIFWLQERVKEAGARGTVVGLSGGLDSAVVAVLCQRAFPQDNLALIMPCHSMEEDVAHARLLAERFAIPYRLVPLDAVYDEMLALLTADLTGVEVSALAKANLKPRLRMLALYFYAAQFNYLVVGTGNRSELAVGYFTKYGDGGVDLLPLGNLVKGEVSALASHLGIPEEIIAKPPSGGLWPGQTDVAEMGITYRDLDAYLKGETIDPAVRARIEAMQKRSRHKRELPPIPEF
ncbi:MAG TPA: NAD(+) synthase [Firmicutes bacterium]|nr:NAD(+) synthase [Bacillota bacterium]